MGQKWWEVLLGAGVIVGIIYLLIRKVEAPPPRAVLFEEHFDYPDNTLPPTFLPLWGEWYVFDKQFFGTGPAEVVAIVPDLVVTDFMVRAKLNDMGNPVKGFTLRFKDVNNNYGCSFDNRTNEAIVTKRYEGVSEDLARFPTGYQQPGVPYIATVVVRGRTITVYFNGTKLGEVTDPDIRWIKEGTVGVSGYKTVGVDDVLVTTV